MAAIQKLIENLHQTQQLYAALIETGGQKKEAIVQNRLNDISQLVARETKLLKELAALEQERLHAISAYQAEIGKNSNHGANLSALIRMTVKSEDKQQLEQGRNEILKLADQLKSINETNQLLIQQALDFVSYTLDLFTGSPEDDVVYQAPVQHPASASSGRKRFFDTRA